MGRPIVFCIVGTRPEAVKMAPVVLELRKRQEVETILVSTGQHREILLSALGTFGLSPDRDLAIMQHGQTLEQITSRALEGLSHLTEELRPSMIVAQGDTTTTFVASLLAFYRRIPFAHVEAGLRTDTIDDPFPEEFNRRATGLVASLHFPPTEWARDNLLREGKDPGRIFVTGNTGIDAVLKAGAEIQEEWYPEHRGRVVTMTTHRRENWGDPQRRIAKAARTIVEWFEDVLLVVALHPNPSVRETIAPILQGHERVRLIEPPEYGRFVKLMQRSSLMLSDSGGVQEEAPAFGVPVLVMRETTERPEGVTAGTARLVGSNEKEIVDQATELLSDSSAYARMANAVSPYGDGKAAERIRYVILRELGIPGPEVPMWT
ncbi:MAG TPA: UDP-N-acetylglucosamine 2-epimerase (non-hydrolyzing) [Fimbriimonas sp.]